MKYTKIDVDKPSTRLIVAVPEEEDTLYDIKAVLDEYISKGCSCHIEGHHIEGNGEKFIIVCGCP